MKATGEDVLIYPLARIIRPGAASMGDHVIIDDFVLLDAGVECRLGSYIHIASFTSIVGGGRLLMADFTTISSGCRVLTGQDDLSGSALVGPCVPDRFREVDSSFVEMKKHSILGANVVVLPGVTIGEGAAVGAGSLVVKDIEAWTVSAGVPSRTINKRPSEIILRMERELLSKE